MPTERSHGWTFTINNYNLEHAQQLIDAEAACRYIIYGFEVGKQGTPHLQCYAYFNQHISFKRFKEFFPNAHVEMSEGTPAQNREYCSKDGHFYEYGKCPLTQAEKGELGNAFYDDIWDKAASGRLMEIPSKQRIGLYNTLKKISIEHAPEMPALEAPNAEWWWGPTGTGKSHRAHELYPDAFYKMANKWWDLYRFQDTVVMEEMDQTHAWLGYYIKQWADKWPFPAEVKFGVMPKLRPKLFIVISNHHPKQIWGHVPEDLGPILRRFRVMHFENPFDPPTENADVVLQPLIIKPDTLNYAAKFNQ